MTAPSELEKALQERDAYKAMLEEAQQHHTACIMDIAELAGVDISDEPRCKWLRSAITDLVERLRPKSEKQMREEFEAFLLEYTGRDMKYLIDYQVTGLDVSWEAWKRASKR